MESHRRCVGLISTIVLLLGAGCRDAKTPLQPDPTPRLSAVAGPGRLRDTGIDTTDTHFGARAITTTTFEQAQPNASITSAPISEVYELHDEGYIEGGYGVGGEVRFGVYWDHPSSSSQLGAIQAIGDVVSTYDRAGFLENALRFNARMAEVGLPGGDLVRAYFFTSGDGGCCGPERARATPGVATTLEESDDWREVRTVLAPAGTGARAAGSPPDQIETVRRYHRVRTPARRPGAEATSSWRLEEVRQSSRISAPSGQLITRSVTRFEYTLWLSDPARDAAREEAASQLPAPQARAEPATPRRTQPASAPAAVTAVCDRKSSRVDRTVVPGSTPVLWQHGFCSEASTWDAMRARVNQDLRIGHERAFSLTSLGRLEDQVDELEQEVVATGVGQNIIVGHSQGGLIARRFAQRRGDLARGVITIGTPHQGALIADLGPDLVSSLMLNVTGSLCSGGPLCEILGAITSRKATGELTYGLAGTIVPVIQDVHTSSRFIDSLNSRYEPFLRAGIEVDAGNRWALMRLVGDWPSDQGRLLSGARPLGNTWARTTEQIYRVGTFLEYLSLFLYWNAAPYGGGVGCMYPGYQAYWPPCYDYNYADYWFSPFYAMERAGILYNLGQSVTSVLDWADANWNYITTRNTPQTDGFIQFASQRYPNTPGAYLPWRYTILRPDGDSHAGEVKSPEGLRMIKAALQVMGVGP